jgi:hypothetical protein
MTKSAFEQVLWAEGRGLLSAIEASRILAAHNAEVQAAVIEALEEVKTQSEKSIAPFYEGINSSGRVIGIDIIKVTVIDAAITKVRGEK